MPKSKRVNQSHSIEFNDGTFMSYEQAAKLIQKEGKLTVGPYIDRKGLRCANAVLENHRACDNCIEPVRCYTPLRDRRIVDQWFSFCLHAQCDRPLEETPEERCTRVVVWVRSLKRK